MAQPISIPEKANTTFQPPCPKCGHPMWLVRLDPYDREHDERTFECNVCAHSQSEVVKFR